MQYGLGLRPHLSHSIPCPVRGVKGRLDGVINWNRGSGGWGKETRDAVAGMGGLGPGSARVPVVGEVCALRAQCEQGIGTGAASARFAPQACALRALGMRAERAGMRECARSAQSGAGLREQI